MKSILLQSVTIPGSTFKSPVDILLSDGKIEKIGNSLPTENAEVIDGKGRWLSPGFLDLNANFGEPGFEHRETIESGTAAAAAGGFTEVCLMPNTEPVIQSKSEVSYLNNRSKGNLVNIHPIGAISAYRQGKDLAELYDMFQHGAPAFSDGNRPVQDAGLMSRALLYAKGFNGLVMSYPEDGTIAGKGKMNEGLNSTLLGMTGIPALAEELSISRDLYLAEYNETKIHFSTISTKGGVELIRKAKQQGLKVTCDVAAHHLLLTDDTVAAFDSNYKVKPPLRTQADIDALLEGLKDGSIDAIVSQHTPQEPEKKDVEFEIAGYGIIGLQTVLPLLLKAGLSAELIVEKLSVAPRRILGRPEVSIEEGASANFTLVDPNATWTFDATTNRSLCTNSPFLGEQFTGKVIFVCNNNHYLKF